MGKLKQTKLKHRKNKDSDVNSDVNSVNHETHDTRKKYKILTSKNKNKLVLKEGRYYRKNDSINKKHKRSRKNFNIRTLDALKKYGVTLKNQDGGFIINYLKFKWNMKKIKKIIEKLGKNQVDINKYIDTYKKQPETFKRLGDKKAVVIYDILRTIKDKTIIQFLLDNKDKEKTYDTSNMEHDLNNIKTKIEITTTNQLKQYNKEIEKEKPILAKNLAKFRKDSAKFRELNAEYSKIMDFYEEQKELSDKYDKISKDEKLTDVDKAIKKKYLKNEANIKYILSYKPEDISAINNNIKEIATLMNMSDDYDKKFKDLTEGKYETDLQKWQANYKDIYVNITEIEGGIKNVSDILEIIKEYADHIGSNLSSIYASIKQSFKLDPILKIKRIIDENLGYLKNIKEVSLKKVKYAFIEQIPIEQIEFYLPLASAALIQTEKSMNELNTSFILDSNFIKTGHAGGGTWKGRRMGMDGVGGINGISNIGELEWFANGGAGVAIQYKDLLTYTIDKFLDTEFENIVATLDQIMLDIYIPGNLNEKSPIFKLKNSEFLDIIKLYFNIYLFFLNILKRTPNDLSEINNINDFNDKENDIFKFIQIILIYEKLDPNLFYSNNTDLTKKYILDNFTKCNGFLVIFNNALSSILTAYKKFFDKKLDKNLNPFIINKKFTVKNLYYEYNKNENTTGNLDCIKEFIGYYNTKSQAILDFNEAEKCLFNEKNLFDDDTLLHNNKYYNNMPILYTNDDNLYNFVTIYYDEDSIKPKTSIKKYTNFDKIKQKYKEFINFINYNFKNINKAITIESTTTEINKLNNSITNDDTILTKPYHLLDNIKINAYITKIIIIINNLPDGIKRIYYDYIKYIIINDWNKDYSIGHDRFREFYTILLNNNELDKNKLETFIDLIKIVTNKDQFYKECMPYLLSSIYNNIGIKDNLYSENPDNIFIDHCKTLSETANTKASEYNKKALDFRKSYDELALVKNKATINTKYYNETYRNEHICKFINLFIKVSNAIDEMVNEEANRVLKAFNCATLNTVDDNEIFKTLEFKNDGVEPTVIGAADAAPGAIQYKTAAIPAVFAIMAGVPAADKFINKFINTSDLEDKLNLMKDINKVHDTIIELPSQPLVKVANISDTLLKDPLEKAFLSFETLLTHFKSHTERQITIAATLKELTDTININSHKPDDNLFKVLKQDNEEKYVVLYKYTPKDLEIELNSNDNMRKYFFTWLKSKINKKPLEIDYMSEFIDNVCSDSNILKKSLSDLNFNKDNIDKINEEHIFLKNFPYDNKISICGIIKTQYDELIKPDQAKKLNILGLKIEDKDIYTTSKTIPERKEDRLYFNLTQSNEVNKRDTYTDAQIKTLSSRMISKITKSYPQKKMDYIKRIVSFNIHYWNNLKLQPSHSLLTNPETAIAFIEEFLPKTDIIGLLDYCLYPKENDSKKHIQKKSTDETNTIQVSNKSISDLISQKLKLNKYIIKNDYYGINNTNTPATPEIFLGKAIYYDNTTSITDELNIPIDATNRQNVILYSKVKINHDHIGLYLVNLYTTPNKALIDNIKEEIEKHRDDISEINELVIMGNFNIDINKHQDVFDDIIKDPNYIRIGNNNSTFIDNERHDLCFVSKPFFKKFTILNQNNIVVPSGSVSNHYPIYLDIIENDDKEINESNVRTIEKDGTVIIDIPLAKLKFILKPKKSITMPGGGPKSLDLTTDYVLEKLTKDGVKLIDVSKDPVFSQYKIEIEDKKIIKIKNEEGKLKYSINEEGILTTFKNDGTSIESITMRDPKNDKVFINKDADGKVVSVSEIADDGSVTTKDISTGEVVKTYYEEEDDKLEKAKQEGKRLLSTFIDDIKKENLTMVSKNKLNILSYIKKIIDLIQTRLKPKNYEDIKLKLDALAKNIIELKAIEPKLTPDKVLIKEYAQKSRSYDWMEDVTKREKSSLSLEDEAKELEAIIKTHPEIKDILPSSGERLTKENILEIIGSIDLRKNEVLNKTFLEKFQNKLKQPENARVLMKHLDDTYTTAEQLIYKCIILTIVNTYSPLKLYSDELLLRNCIGLIKTKVAEKIDKSKKTY